MNKAMSKIAQINKEELSKVELAIDDYKRFEKEILNVSDDAKKTISKLKALTKQADALYDEARKQSTKASQILKEAESIKNDDLQKAKELGVDTKVIEVPFQSIERAERDTQKLTEDVIQSLRGLI